MVQISMEDKANLYSAAVIEALAIAGKEIGQPDINAAIAALTHAQAYLIAKIDDRKARRLAEKHAVEGLGDLISAEVNARIIRETATGKQEGGN